MTDNFKDYGICRPTGHEFDHSISEISRVLGSSGMRQLHGTISTVKILDVNKEGRYCTVEGFNGRKFELVPWCSQSYDYQTGSGDGVIPKVNAIYLATLMGHQAVLLMPLPILDSNGTYKLNQKDSQNSNDRTIMVNETTGIEMKSAGIIRTIASNLCQRVMSLASNVIEDVCENFRIRTGGGEVSWMIDESDGVSTNFKAKFWRNTDPKNGFCVDLEMGKDADGIKIVVNGNADIRISKDAKIRIENDATIDVCNDAAINVWNNCNIDVGAPGNQYVGDCNIDVKRDAKVQVGRDTELKTNGNMHIESGQDMLIKAGGTMTLEAPLIQENPNG